MWLHFLFDALSTEASRYSIRYLSPVYEQLERHKLRQKSVRVKENFLLTVSVQWRMHHLCADFGHFASRSCMQPGNIIQPTSMQLCSLTVHNLGISVSLIFFLKKKKAIKQIQVSHLH
jgi:hypothetical protein